MKTLIVKYLPSGAASNTKKLLDFFTQEISGQEIEVIDLLKTPVPIFNEESIQPYYKRNFRREELDEKEAKLLAENDRLIAQLKSADILVLASPMHNFSFPAAIKAYLDAVIFNGETCHPKKKMMAGKKALTLFTSAGIYSEEKFSMTYPDWNTLAFCAKVNFGYMGYDEAEVIGTSLGKDAEKNLAEVKEKIGAVVKKWYS